MNSAKVVSISSLPMIFQKHCCSICNQHFYVKDFTLKGSRCPMLLQCGHSVCKFCLQQNIKIAKSVICRQCGFVSHLNFVEESIKNFSYNLYVTGCLIAQKSYKSINDEKLFQLITSKDYFNYTAKDNRKIKKDLLVRTCEECSQVADWVCENCTSFLCDICWTKIHSFAKSLMKHLKVPVSTFVSIKNRLKYCPEHETQHLEFYCKKCCVTICSLCVILQHQGEEHCTITLKDKNAEMICQLKSAAQEADVICKRMVHSLEEVRCALKSTDLPDPGIYSNLRMKIAAHFARIHGLLQLEEERMLEKLKDKEKEREKCLGTFRDLLQDQIEIIRNLLREADDFSKSPQLGDSTDVHRQLLEVKKMPCYLISHKINNEEVKVAIEDNLINLMRTPWTLALPSRESFELKCFDNLPKNISEDFAQEVISSQDANISANAETISGSSKRICKNPRPFVEGMEYSIHVSYIKNPEEFYVILNSQRKKQVRINGIALKFATNSNDVPKTVLKDGIYLVMYSVDKKWYRARVVEVFSRADAAESVLVYYLDHGNTERVPVTRLRHAPKELTEEPPLATRCKLFDCFPKNGVWCMESTKVMGEILAKYPVTMLVMKVCSDCLEVDLSKICSDAESEIISVRDSLMFLEFTIFMGGEKKKLKGLKDAPRFFKQLLPTPGNNFKAILTHVNSPSDFYLQRINEDVSYIQKSSRELQIFYSSNSHKGIIYNPVEGMPCAAMCSENQMWFRGKIVKICGRRMVSVLFVDYGNEELLPWTSIRKLNENFLKYAPLAIHCSFAEIQPKGSTSWDSEAILYLKKLARGEELRVIVQGETTSKEKLKVFLYKKVGEKEICVNEKFLDFGYAVKSNPNSPWMKYRIEEEILVDITSELLFNQANLKTRYKEENASNVLKWKTKRKGTLGKWSKNKLSAKELRERHNLMKEVALEKKDDKNAEEGEEEKTLSKDEHKGTVFKIKVEILSAESPSSIYVTFPKFGTVLNELHSKLNEHYANSKPEEEKEWNVNEKCVVLNSERNTWCRGVILEILPGEKVKVFLKDVALMCVEPKSSLRVLLDIFLRYPPCAVKCHLSGIKPVGVQWPDTTCEFLLNELQMCRNIYLTRNGEIENKSLPVELWIETFIPGGALEPSITEFITINHLLVEQGLAIPVKPQFLCNSNANSCGSGNKVVKFYEEVRSQGDVEEKELSASQSDSSGPCLATRWLTPAPLKRSRFVGVPTYVDADAIIYMYDVAEDESKLKMIQHSLAEEYKNSKPNDEDRVWSPQDLCTVRYHLDNLWYRGLVLKVNDNFTYDVLFVDYGNVETCQISDLRKNIKMIEIPVLSHKFRLQGLIPASPDRKWSVSVIDFLHSCIVDKRCDVTVVDESHDVNEPSAITLKIIEVGVDVSSLLQGKGLALFDHGLLEQLDKNQKPGISEVMILADGQDEEESFVYSCNTRNKT